VARRRGRAGRARGAAVAATQSAADTAAADFTRSVMLVRVISLMILGPFLGFFGIYHGREAVQAVWARSWQPVPCVIRHCTVDSGTVQVGVKEHRRQDTEYRLTLSYGYTLAGQSYPGWRYRFSPLHDSTFAEGALQAVCRQYAAGSGHTCFVDPADPAESVLVREASGGAWLALGAALSYLLLLLVPARVYRWVRGLWSRDR
jgi:hypothetical protein